MVIVLIVLHLGSNTKVTFTLLRVSEMLFRFPNSLNIFLEHCYQFVSRNLEFNEANRVCTDSSSYLMRIDNDGEYNLMRQIFDEKKLSGKDIWVSVLISLD